MANTKVEVIIRLGPDRIQRRIIQAGEHLIGTDPSCSLQIEGDGVSRKHARLTFDGGKFLIEDLGSTNGTFLDRVRLTGVTPLRFGQQLQIGQAVLEIVPAVQKDNIRPASHADAPPVPDKKNFAQARLYKIGREVARGGMGSIREAEHVSLRRKVAMKVMLPGKQTAREAALRFEREAQVLAQLEHPNIVPVHDLGLDEAGQIFYTMKFVKGVTLKQILEEIKAGNTETVAKFPLSQLLTIFQKVCDAVSFAHSKGVIHRDLKPENIMSGDFGEVLVMDWGLAKMLDHSSSFSSANLESLKSRTRTTDEDEHDDPGQQFEAIPVIQEPNAIQTLEGRIMGSPHFMSPEQAEGRISDIDTRTDVFALGGILYNILTLSPPVSGASVQEVLEKIRQGQITAPSTFGKTASKQAHGSTSADSQSVVLLHCPGRRIPEALSAVTMKVLSFQPGHRYQMVADLQKEIAAYQGGFATSAEQASAWRLLTLAVKRRQTEFGISAVAAVLFLALAAGFVWKVTHTLAQLRKAVPSFYAEARALMQEKKFHPALEKISYAISLAPTEAEYHLVRGNIHQSLLRIAEAREDYARTLKREPRHAQALENLQLSEKLLSENHGKQELSLESLNELRMAMINQGRSAEAVAMAEKLAASEKGLFDSVKLALATAGVNGELTKDENGLLALSLSGSSIKDLSPLKALRLSSLNVSFTSIADLTPLRGMPLNYLGLWGCSAITNIEAVRGMPLTNIVLNQTQVGDLSPLAGAKLAVLEILGTPVTDLTLLKEMPLKTLRMDGCTNVQDFSPLRSLPLETLRVPDMAISDLSFVTNLSLVELYAGRTKIISLAPLKGMSLTRLDIEGTSVSDLSPLAGMPLTQIDLRGTLVSNLTALKGMPLKNLALPHTRVSDLSPLKGMALSYCEMRNTLVTDVSPLAGMPLNWLSLGGTEVTDLSSLAGTTIDGALVLDDTKISDLISLKGIKFSSLSLCRTRIGDLSPLKGMSLKALFLESCVNLRDLSPLAECQQLEVLTIPATAKNVEVLRALPNLKQLGYIRPDNDWQRVQTAAEFWKEYDARKK